MERAFDVSGPIGVDDSSVGVKFPELLADRVELASYTVFSKASKRGRLEKLDGFPSNFFLLQAVVSL